MRQGGIIKCAAAYRRPFWRDRGLSGEAYAPRGLVRAVVDVSPPEAHDTAMLQAFLVGDDARAAARLEPAARRAAVLAAMADLLGPEAGAPVDWAERDWAADPWSGGCVAYLPPGAMGEGLDALRAPVGRLAFAGTETARLWPRYMEGAVEAGERAADEAMALVPPRCNMAR
jgi:monoamine oxidase